MSFYNRKQRYIFQRICEILEKKRRIEDCIMDATEKAEMLREYNFIIAGYLNDLDDVAFTIHRAKLQVENDARESLRIRMRLREALNQEESA